MDEKTIAVDRFNAGYDKTYKAWLKDNIQEEDKYALESVTQELESLRSDLGELNLWIEDKKNGMCREDWEEKGRRSEGYLLMIQYRFQHLIVQNKRSKSEAGPSGTS
ncbi:hypothetical protein R3W88_001402 [Solanum pinnatisectum]|uniref:Uncharacterized protein n=1 Tax=Solanum pinnatisectum TaxID=50273 RepID=A0AAV9MLE0_9SOLN|nr:hypothetical protein R3W88_001402 [Solanum pinnatisectum]